MKNSKLFLAATLAVAAQGHLFGAEERSGVGFEELMMRVPMFSNYLYGLSAEEMRQKYSDHEIVHFTFETAKSNLPAAPTVLPTLLQLVGIENINTMRDQHGRALLHYAVQTRHGNAKVLLDAGANPNVRDSQQNTPLHYAVNSGMILAIGHLLGKENVEINAANGEGKTPLHYIAEDDDLISEMLLENKSINIWATDLKGITPLHDQGQRKIIYKTIASIITSIEKLICEDGGRATEERMIFLQGERSHYLNLKEQIKQAVSASQQRARGSKNGACKS
ncbi:MAG: ankyrin repeat domain-containing protein [Epsilonproteobacteria bacterium]|nr:ankyrin repeat domain-containing protein [Campylobacterota bacterium]